MRRDWAALFPLNEELVMFNHASYGLATSQVLARAEAARRELEYDPIVNLGHALRDRIMDSLDQICVELGLNPRYAALTSNATTGAAALQRSLPLDAGGVVMALDCEYSSVLRGWRHRCAEVGAELRIVPVDVPLLDMDLLLDSLTAAAGNDEISILQISAVTSSTAVQLPVSRLAAWGHDRGAVVVVDAAHVPGHLEIANWQGADVAFATVHKWFPVARSVGILWAAPQWAPLIRPAQVSLTWDQDSLADRFIWPGTFDPVPWLCVPEAIATQRQWAHAGELDRCERLADDACVALSEAGAEPTAIPGMRPPRLRAFSVPGVPAEVLRQRLADMGIRAWTGTHREDSSLVRLATHVYNDHADIEIVRRVVEAALAAREV